MWWTRAAAPARRTIGVAERPRPGCALSASSPCSDRGCTEAQTASAQSGTVDLLGPRAFSTAESLHATNCTTAAHAASKHTKPDAMLVAVIYGRIILISRLGGRGCSARSLNFRSTSTAASGSSKPTPTARHHRINLCGHVGMTAHPRACPKPTPQAMSLCPHAHTTVQQHRDMAAYCRVALWVCGN